MNFWILANNSRRFLKVQFACCSRFVAPTIFVLDMAAGLINVLHFRLFGKNSFVNPNRFVGGTVRERKNGGKWWNELLCCANVTNIVRKPMSERGLCVNSWGVIDEMFSFEELI